MSKSKSVILSIVTIFCIGLIAGNTFGRFMQLHQYNIADVDGFGRLGQHFAKYGDLDNSIRRGPVYPVFIGLIYRIFGENHSNIIFFQAVLLGILGICVFLVSYDNFNSIRIAFLTGICTVLNPICLWYVPRLWVELLFATLVMPMIWMAYKALCNSTWWNLFIFGILAGIASLCKAVILIFPLFLACSILVLYKFNVKPLNRLNGRTLLKIFVIPTGAMLITIFPWTIRNYIVSDTWTLVSSNVGVEFFRGNIYAEQNSFLLQKSVPEIWEIAIEKEEQILRQRGIEKPSSKETDKIFDRMMIDYITYHPLQFTVKIIKQIPAFWMRGETTKNSIVFILLALSTLVFCVKGFLVLRETSIFAYIVLILIIYINFLYAATLAWARYSIPLYPPMIILACAVGLKRRRGDVVHSFTVEEEL